LGLPFPYVGYGLAFNYDAEAITDIRLAEHLSGKSKGLITAPRIEFSYRGGTIGFGSGLQTQEALKYHINHKADLSDWVNSLIQPVIPWELPRAKH
jgi:hypothetical protein